jgi:general secretion pathway protein K
MGRPTRWTSERGASLISALLLVALMASVATALATDLRFSMRRSANMEVRDQSYWYALGARDFTEALIGRALANPDRAFRPDAPWLQGPSLYPIEQGQLSGRIIDGNNCFNLNALVSDDGRGGLVADSAQRGRFEQVMIAAGLPVRLAAQIAAQSADWIDSDRRPLASGAEDDVYGRRSGAYRTGNTLMAEREEMLALAAMTPDAWRVLAPLVCVRPEAAPLALNINTLQADGLPLLIGLFDGRLTRTAAEGVLLQRPPDGYGDVEAFWAQPAIAALEPDAGLRSAVGLTTQYFEVEIEVVHAGARFGFSETVEARGGGRLLRLSQRFGSFS